MESNAAFVIYIQIFIAVPNIKLFTAVTWNNTRVCLLQSHIV
jgi:hypothetical protein